MADTATELLAALVRTMGASEPVKRMPVRSWDLSGVERIHFRDGRRCVFKHAKTPLTLEADTLTHAGAVGIPVPLIYASEVREGHLGMLMEDLGIPMREAAATDAAIAAARVHSATTSPHLPVLGAKALTGLPSAALVSLSTLRARGRWAACDDVADLLEAAATVAAVRAEGTELPPFGLCHSEFHPTSLHVGSTGWRLLDWARAFTGPGLFDLVSWQGTTRPADTDAAADLIALYRRAGGAPDAVTPRGGLPPAVWAVGWHRLWIVAWYLEQATTWINNPDEDPFVQHVVRRHLKEAAACLSFPVPVR